MSGLLIFVEVHPTCVGPGAGTKVPVELDSMGTAGDLIKTLAVMDAVLFGFKVEWQGSYLAPTDVLADVGLCPQSTVSVVPVSPEERMRLGEELYAAVESSDKEAVERTLLCGADPNWIPEETVVTSLDSTRYPRFYTPLRMALCRLPFSALGRPEIVFLLLDRGADVNMTTRNGG
eukprot:Hpha_TRINITY_DN27608_c0_g1::TRINITY_DN27608_c0_g1_i1::g.57441::m.57441